MVKSYINRVKANISLYSSKRTRNVLEGSYKSIYHGRSMDFDDLREYNYGDNVKDIDWKSSSRTGRLLVRRYIAEKKHYVLILLDSGKKMDADTESGASKKEVALLTAGTIAYLAYKNHDEIGFVFNKNNRVTMHPFKTSDVNIELSLNDYDVNGIKGNYDESSVEKNLNYILHNINKRMIIFVITDRYGTSSVSPDTIKKISYNNDIFFINIADAFMTEQGSYDIDAGSYIPTSWLYDGKLHDAEIETRKEIDKANREKLKDGKVEFCTIDTKEEIVSEIVSMIERFKDAGRR
jgi:hypothetical protein